MDFKKMKKVDRKVLGFLERERNAARKSNRREMKYKLYITNALIKNIRRYGWYDDSRLETERFLARDKKNYDALCVITDLQVGIRKIHNAEKAA